MCIHLKRIFQVRENIFISIYFHVPAFFSIRFDLMCACARSCARARACVCVWIDVYRRGSSVRAR